MAQSNADDFDDSVLRLGQDDMNHDGALEEISIKFSKYSFAEVFNVIRFTTVPMEDIKYYFIRKFTTSKFRNCYEPPEDGQTWESTSQNKKYLNMKKGRKLSGLRGAYKPGEFNVHKSYVCYYNKMPMNCPATKSTSVGECIRFLNREKQPKVSYKLFYVKYQNKHNHEKIEKIEAEIKEIKAKKESKEDNTVLPPLTNPKPQINENANVGDGNTVKHKPQKNTPTSKRLRIFNAEDPAKLQYLQKKQEIEEERRSMREKENKKKKSGEDNTVLPPLNNPKPHINEDAGVGDNNHGAEGDGAGDKVVDFDEVDEEGGIEIEKHDVDASKKENAAQRLNMSQNNTTKRENMDQRLNRLRDALIENLEIVNEEMKKEKEKNQKREDNIVLPPKKEGGIEIEKIEVKQKTSDPKPDIARDIRGYDNTVKHKGQKKTPTPQKLHILERIRELENIQALSKIEKNEEKYCCNKCNFKFNDLIDTIKHVAREHVIDILYKLPEGQLNCSCHNVPLGTRVYHCDLCPKASYEKFGLFYHQLKRHDNSIYHKFLSPYIDKINLSQSSQVSTPSNNDDTNSNLILEKIYGEFCPDFEHSNSQKNTFIPLDCTRLKARETIEGYDAHIERMEQSHARLRALRKLENDFDQVYENMSQIDVIIEENAVQSLSRLNISDNDTTIEEDIAQSLNRLKWVLYDATESTHEMIDSNEKLRRRRQKGDMIESQASSRGKATYSSDDTNIKENVEQILTRLNEDLLEDTESTNSNIFFNEIFLRTVKGDIIGDNWSSSQESSSTATYSSDEDPFLELEKSSLHSSHKENNNTSPKDVGRDNLTTHTTLEEDTQIQVIREQNKTLKLQEKELTLEDDEIIDLQAGSEIIPDVNDDDLNDLFKYSQADDDLDKLLDDESLYCALQESSVKGDSQPNSVQFRTFSNDDKETCWINSCLQLLLCAIDITGKTDKKNITEEGTEMWRELRRIWQLGHIKIDPLTFRKILFETEAKRIKNENPTSRGVFYQEGPRTFAENVMSFGKRRFAQQDCQDFFVCFSQNYEKWLDVFLLFKTLLYKVISCTACNTSKDLSQISPFIYLDCPKEDTSMNAYIHEYFNAPELVTLTHEACGNTSEVQKALRIGDMRNQKFLIFLVKRLEEAETHETRNTKHVIHNTKLEVTPTIDIIDMDVDGYCVQFKPVGVITHIGNITKNNKTQGHYIADVLNVDTNTWVRTSDSNPPENIEFSEISKTGYIYLYENTFQHTQTPKLKPRKYLPTHLNTTQTAVVDEATKKDTEYDKSQPTELPSITPKMNTIIEKSLKKKEKTQIINAHKITIRGMDIQTLTDLTWLNDEVINFYLQMIVVRSQGDKKKFRSVYAFSTFFYPRLLEVGWSGTQRWTKKVDLFSYSLILIPVHLGTHWCLATIDIEAKTFGYYDSMNGSAKGAFKAISSYLQLEHLAKKGSALDLSKWEQINTQNIPQQLNGSDCGMFLCKFAEYLSRRAEFTFSQSNMPYFRKRMVYEISKNDILYP